MCNLYSQTMAREAMLRLFRVSPNRAAMFAPQDAIFPGYQAPVVRHAADGEREIVLMNWGFLLLMKGLAPRRVTNVRDDKIKSSAMWRQSFEQRRCLVPATSFCEPNDGRAKGEPATWHWFALKGETARPPYAFAGIWRPYTGPVRKDGPTVTQDVYSILTTSPNALTVSINHERSPVLLASEPEQRAWLDGTPQDAFALAQPFDPDGMHIVQRGADKQDFMALPEP